MVKKSRRAPSSRKKPRTFAQALAAAERRKPTKALVELMKLEVPWVPKVTVGVGSISPFKASSHFEAAKMDDEAIISEDFKELATCAWCGARPGEDHKRTCKSIVVGAAALAENNRLVAANPNAKPSNPKDALGILKIPYSTISQPVIAETGVAMLEGALKYGRHNYRAIGVRASVYFDAVMARHLPAWWEGEDIDPDSGMHHIVKAIASLCVIRDAMIQGKFIDDRPPKSPAGWQEALNVRVKALLEKYKGREVAPYIEGDERMKS